MIENISSFNFQNYISAKKKSSIQVVVVVIQVFSGGLVSEDDSNSNINYSGNDRSSTVFKNLSFVNWIVSAKVSTNNKKVFFLLQS